MEYSRQWLKRNPENFAVASWLVPGPVRASVLALYSFARGADEMADAPGQSAAQRRAALDRLESAFSTFDEGTLPDFAVAYARLARLHPFLLACGRDLLSAFHQDTLKTRYRDMADLLDYCKRSAAPIGRAFLYMGAEKQADRKAADALCNALQIINHLQDCGDDYVRRGRVYLPTEWFASAGIEVDALGKSVSSAPLGRVIRRGVEEAERLLAQAKPLFATIQSPYLRTEIRFIYLRALKLCAALRLRDPLRERVRLGPVQVASCLGVALLRSWR